MNSIEVKLPWFNVSVPAQICVCVTGWEKYLLHSSTETIGIYNMIGMNFPEKMHMECEHTLTNFNVGDGSLFDWVKPHPAEM